MSAYAIFRDHLLNLGDSALERLVPGEPLSSEAIHYVRVQTKRMRASWQILRVAFPVEVCRRANRNISDAAKLIAGQRDRKVMNDTLSKLARKNEGSTELIECLRTALFNHLPEPKESKGNVDAIRLRIARGVNPLKRRSLVPADDHFLANGITRSYRKGRKLALTAFHSEDDEAFHEWRKWAKYLLYQFMVVQDLGATGFEESIDLLAKLGKILGDSHDLYVLNQTAHQCRLALTPAEFEQLQTIIKDRDAGFRLKSQQLFDRLYPEKPKNFERNLIERLA